MADIAELPYYEVTFAADGTLTADGGLPAAVQAGSVTDLFVLSHGWNDSAGSARRLYQGMFTLLAGMLGARRTTSAAVGVFWPSLLFPEDDPATPNTPSTGAQLASALAPSFPGKQQDLVAMGTMLDTQPQDATQLQQFHQIASGLVTSPPLAPEDAGAAGGHHRGHQRRVRACGRDDQGSGRRRAGPAEPIHHAVVRCP